MAITCTVQLVVHQQTQWIKISLTKSLLKTEVAYQPETRGSLHSRMTRRHSEHTKADSRKMGRYGWQRIPKPSHFIPWHLTTERLWVQRFFFFFFYETVSEQRGYTFTLLHLDQAFWYVCKYVSIKDRVVLPSAGVNEWFNHWFIIHKIAYWLNLKLRLPSNEGTAIWYPKP